ncbi:MAG: PIN domain-containing protein, partial [Candidatus Acidiferrum sp.]
AVSAGIGILTLASLSPPVIPNPVARLLANGGEGSAFVCVHALHQLPYADCFAAALAAHRQATLATSDKHFARVETQLRVLWTTKP